MAAFQHVDSDISVQSSTGSMPVPSSAVQADTLPLRSTLLTLLYEVADAVRGAAAPQRSSTSMLCFHNGTGMGNDLEQTIRQELLTCP